MYLGVRLLLAGLWLLRSLLRSILLRLPLIPNFALLCGGSGATGGSASSRLLEVIAPHPAVAAAACTHTSLT